MPDLGLPTFLLAASVVVLIVLWRVGTFTPAAVRAWTRISRHHHLTHKRPLEERLGDRVPWLASLFRETSVPRLLKIANRSESLNTWLMRVTIQVTLLAVAILVVDLVASFTFGQLPLPPLVCLVLAGLSVPYFYLSLQRVARRRQEAINASIAQSLTEMAILTYTGQYTISGALEFVARCHKDGALLDFLSKSNTRQLRDPREPSIALSLRPDQLLSTVTIYEHLGREYDVKMLTELAGNMRRVAEKGLAPADVLTALATTTMKRQIAEMNIRTEQARPRMSLAIGLMALPLLSLLIFPTASAVISAFK